MIIAFFLDHTQWYALVKSLDPDKNSLPHNESYWPRHALIYSCGADTYVAGNDTLLGGASNDRLRGGAGVDRMSGGSRREEFIFSSYSKFRRTAYDTITDFSGSAGDHINLSYADANTRKSGIQAFDFIGRDAFSGVVGDLRYDRSTANGTMIYADVNGDRVADLTIQLSDPMVLKEACFIL